MARANGSDRDLRLEATEICDANGS